MTPLALRNPKVQRLRRLTGRRHAREEEGAFVLEGATLLGEALEAGTRLEAVYVEAGTNVPAVDRARSAGVVVHEVATGVIGRVADTVTSRPVLTVAPRPRVPLEKARGSDLVIVCVDVRDPGNAGTVLRSGEAAGVGAVICCDGVVDVFGPKCVRASAGSILRVPVVTGGDPVKTLSEVGSWGLQRVGAVARGGVPYDEADLRRPTALVLGNEAHGLPEEVASAVDTFVTIPMVGRTESLNVGMVASVICFEALRQRRRTQTEPGP